MWKASGINSFLFAQNPRFPDCARDGRAFNCPSAADPAVIPFTRATAPATPRVVALAGLPGLAGVLNSLRLKFRNRQRLLQQSFLPNVFEHVSTEYPYVDPALAGRGEYYDFQIRSMEMSNVRHVPTMTNRSNDNHATDGKILTLGGKRD